MAGIAAHGILIHHLAGGVNTIREDGCHIYLEILILGIVGGVGILHEVLTKNNTLGVLGVDDYSRSNIHRSGDAVIPYSHLVEVAALVEREDAVLAIDTIVETHGKAQWPVVEKLIGCPAIGEADVVAIDDGGSTATECWTHLIAVETVSAIHMITQFVDKLVVITVFHHEVGGVLHPHVIAIGILARALQGRTIAAIGTTVVLPCYVIHTLGIHSAVASIDV